MKGREITFWAATGALALFMLAISDIVNERAYEKGKLNFKITKQVVAEQIDKSGRPRNIKNVFSSAHQGFAYYISFKGAMPGKTNLRLYLYKDGRHQSNCKEWITQTEQGIYYCQWKDGVFPPGSYEFHLYAHDELGSKATFRVVDK